MNGNMVLGDASRHRNALPGLRWMVYVVLAALLWLGTGVGVPPALGSLTPRAQGLITIFLGIFLEALPFVVAGVLVSTLFTLFVSDRTVQRVAPRTWGRAAVAGALLGLVVPVGETGNIPIARRLLHKGAPLPLGISFLLGAPVVNPLVIAATLVAFPDNWLIVGGRIALTLVIAIMATLVLVKLPNQAGLLAPDSVPAHDGVDGSIERSFGAWVRHTSDEFIDMTRWLIVGSLGAATLQTLVPQGTLLAIGNDPFLSVLVLLALAVVLSVSSISDTFVASALGSTFGPGALVAFLVFGPMLDLKSVLMFLTTLSPRAVALLVGIIAPLVIAAGIFINLVAR
jgi:hypothetical protein